jgi:hypothetical protein
MGDKWNNATAVGALCEGVAKAGLLSSVVDIMELGGGKFACESRLYAWCCSNIVPKRKKESVCVGSRQRDCGRKGVGTFIRSIPMFLMLREPGDSLATAVITYRNEDRLTRRDQQLS